MGILFDEVDDCYVVADSDDLALPGGLSPWCIGVWTRVDDTEGTRFQYAYSHGQFLQISSYHLYMSESTGLWFAEVHHGGGGGGLRRLQLRTANYGGDGVDRLFILQNTAAGVKQLLTCPLGGDAVLEEAVSDQTSPANPSGLLNLARRADAQSERYFGGVLGEFFKGDFALSVAEIEALAAGQSILGIGKTPDIYLPMVNAAEEISDSSENNNAAVRIGAPQTVTPHFIGPAAGSNVAVKAVHHQRMRQS